MPGNLDDALNQLNRAMRENPNRERAVFDPSEPAALALNAARRIEENFSLIQAIEASNEFTTSLSVEERSQVHKEIKRRFGLTKN